MSAAAGVTAYLSTRMRFLQGAPVLAAVQIPLPGSSIPQFVDPLPLLHVAGGPMETIVAGEEEIALTMQEFQASVMPSTFLPAAGPYTGTWVWGYRAGITPINPAGTYIGPVIVARRNQPAQLRFVNNLTANNIAWREWTDQTLHWADPLNSEMNMCAHTIQPGQPPVGDCADHYTGPVPAVVHLHGGEIPPVLDGGPDAWFTRDGAYHGHAYYTQEDADGNEAIYRYPNTQEAAMIWFHDHVLGATRLNVYAGLAGAYAIIDPDLSLPPGLHPVGLQQSSSGPVDYIIPLVLQDRMFDIDGQFFLPSLGINPEHPYWVPEFVGDTIVVNGKVWPFLDVQPRRYRFLIINGSNARTYELFLTNPVTKVMGPPIWQIGTDGGYLDTPGKIDPNAPKGQLQRLVLMPGERADLIIDFAGFQGQTLIMRNLGRAPYPGGAPPDGATVGRIIQIRVGQALTEPDLSYDPASGTPLRPPMVRLVAPATGTLAPGVTANKTRELTLNEVMGAGGPLEILVNNTRWDGKRGDGSTRSDFTPIPTDGSTEYFSELPNEGDTEVWEIVNLTADAHPIHTHLTQFQLINRQNFNVNKYNKAYAAAFPGGLYIPAYGPPLDYNTGNPRALGGNPDITPFLQGPAMPPNANEAGWKDTVIMYPGQVTRIAVRFAPTDKAIDDSNLFYPFDPDAGGHGYVWHCHIIDHEDNEMMRPYAVRPKLGATRTYVQGEDY
ncbi:MAG: multicopper oxidase [Ardenticatenaceae bacterium]|nr:multicopper oxidase [Ardenticatenaceae bacterium]HBY98298.1 copper oxidase [Chloroflexota bacterium]